MSYYFAVNTTEFINGMFSNKLEQQMENTRCNNFQKYYQIFSVQLSCKSNTKFFVLNFMTLRFL